MSRTRSAVRSAPAAPTRETMARHFAKSYGKRGLRRLLGYFDAPDRWTNSRIAPVFGVSPERVAQWRAAFVEPVRVYAVHPAVARLLGPGALPQARLDHTNSAAALVVATE